jgi:hypothetical protein
MKLTTFNQEKIKAPKGNSKSPRSLHIGTFWEIRFIIPPEEEGQVAGFSKSVYFVFT